MHIMAQNVGNDDTQDIYELNGFWIGMLFAIVKKYFFAFYRDLWGRVFVKKCPLGHLVVHVIAHFVQNDYQNHLEVQS